MPTFTAHRQRTAKAFGEFFAGTATSGSSTNVLEIAKWPIKTNLTVDDYWKDKWLLRPASVSVDDKVRVVQTYTPPLGQFTPDLPYVNTAYTGGVGELVELHSMIEPGTVLPDLMNRGLRRCFVVVEISFHPTPLQQEHDLTLAYPWLREPAWVYQAGWLGPYDSRKQVNPFRRFIPGEPVKRGSSVVLDHKGITFNASDKLYVLCLKPAYYHCTSKDTAYTPTNITTDGTYWTVTVGSVGGLTKGDLVDLNGWIPTYFNNSNMTIFDVPSGTTFRIEEPWQPGAVTTVGTVVGRTLQSGLALEGDQCLILEEWCAAAALIEGWTDYAHILEPSANQRLIRDRKEAQAWFTAMVMQELKPHLPPRLFHKLLQWGPTWRWGSMGSLSVG